MELMSDRVSSDMVPGGTVNRGSGVSESQHAKEGFLEEVGL